VLNELYGSWEKFGEGFCFVINTVCLMNCTGVGRSLVRTFVFKVNAGCLKSIRVDNECIKI